MDMKKKWFSQYRRRRQIGIDSTARIKKRAAENHRFAAPGEDQVRLGYDGPSRKKQVSTLSDNQVHPVIQHLASREMTDRYQLRFNARRRSVRPWQELLSRWWTAVSEGCHEPREVSMAFRNGPLIGGVSWIRIVVDEVEDPLGKIVVEELPMWQMLWDANGTRKMNLIDRDWHIHGDWYSLPVAQAMWPHKSRVLRRAVGSSPDWEEATTGADVTPWEGELGTTWEELGSYYKSKEKEVWIERYEWREPAARFFVLIPNVDEEQAAQAVQEGADPSQVFSVSQMTPREFEEFSAAYESNTGVEIPESRWDRQDRMVYRYAYVVGEEVLESGELESNRFHYEATTGHAFVQPHCTDWRSTTDGMRTPQLWYNVFLTMLLKQLQTNPKGVLIAERGAFGDRSQALRQWAAAGGFIEAQPGTLRGNSNPPFRFESGGNTSMHAMVRGMVQFAQDLIPRSVGFNQAAMGQVGPDPRRVSNALIENLRSQAAASQANLFDALALTRERIGRVALALLSRLGMEHLERVVGEDALVQPVKGPDGTPVYDETVLRGLIESGQVDPAAIVASDPGEPYQVRLRPPDEILNESAWALAVEHVKPTPDRTRETWQSLSEQGVLEALISFGVLTREMLVDMIPNITERDREALRQVARRRDQAQMSQEQQQAQMAQQQAQQAQQPPPPERS